MEIMARALRDTPPNEARIRGMQGAGGAALMALILWECNDCIPGCKLTAHIDLDDPPEGCPWAHQNTEDPNRCNWKAKKVLDD